MSTESHRRLLPRLMCLSMIAYGICEITAPPAAAQMAMVREADIKAAFVYNFARFTTWPADAFTSETAPFRVEVVGRDPFDGRLDQVMAGKTIDKHPIRVSYTLSDTAMPSGHVVVISSSEVKRVQRLLDTASGQPMLTVSDVGQFVERGGVIGFVPEGNTIRFDVNMATVRHARLRIDSRMLAVARALVKDGSPAQSNSN